jgi:hypothetical protein
MYISKTFEHSLHSKIQILKEYFSQIFRGRNQDHSSKECFVNNNFLKTSCYKKETEHYSFVNTDAEL